MDAQILGISTDSKFSHLEWIRQALGELSYPLLSDITRQVSRDYGVLLERLGAALRGTFLVGPDGLLRAYMVQDLTVGRNLDEVLRLLAGLRSGKLCASGWRPGDPFLPPLPKNVGG